MSIDNIEVILLPDSSCDQVGDDPYYLLNRSLAKEAEAQEREAADFHRSPSGRRIVKQTGRFLVSQDEDGERFEVLPEAKSTGNINGFEV